MVRAVIIPIVYGLLFVLTGAVWIARQRSRERRREVDAGARIRVAVRLAQARADAGMPGGHPENPEPPGQYELAVNGGLYAHFTGQLADINADTPGGDE